MKGYIYCIYNKINNKAYIGQTINFDKRVKEHIRKLNQGKHANIHLQHSWNKYGEYCFEFYLLLSDINEEDLNKYETMYIQLFNTFNYQYGYNLTLGGDGVSGYTHDEDALQRMRDNHADFSGEKHPFYNKKHTDEVRLVISECMKGENNGMYGRRHSEETRKLISEKMKIVNSNNDRRKYGEFIEQVKEMLDKGMTQLEISNILNIPQPYVSKIKNGKY